MSNKEGSVDGLCVAARVSRFLRDDDSDLQGVVDLDEFVVSFLFDDRARFAAFADGLLTADELSRAIVDAIAREYFADGPFLRSADDARRASALLEGVTQILVTCVGKK